MTINKPLGITSRLLPGVLVADGEMSLDYSKNPGRGTATRYHWYIDIPAGSFDGEDLQSGQQGGGLQEGFASLLSFLTAAVESYKYKGTDGENADLFPLPVVEWASQNSSELEMLAYELGEAERDSVIAE